MKPAIDIFTELGERLTTFGRDESSRKAIECACRENGWFLPEEIVASLRAIRSEYLSREKLTVWLERYRHLPPPPSRSVLVVMAGNIPLVGFFDLLCVITAGHRCLVKMSGKDRVLMRYVIDLLKEIEPEIPIEYYTDDTPRPFDAVIATGSDNANRYFRARYAGRKALLRGNRHSAAVLSGGETPEQLAALSEDVFAYSGLGCRNISLIFTPEGTVTTFPARPMNEKYRNNYRQRRALRQLCRESFDDLGYAMLVRQERFPQALSEISVIEYRNLEEVRNWLRIHDTELQCVVSECIEHPRRVPFGRAQQPTLTDYPDAMDVMEFLFDL